MIGFDSRRMPPEFAREAALVFAARGVKAMLFDALRPVPIVSYAVRHLNAIAGVVITASHNPPQYNGYKVYAEDGAQGVEVAKREMPDLILMDVVMPNLNGFQGTRSISKNADTAHIPIILVTTKDQETDRVWGMRQGAKAYLTKPVTEGALTRLVKELLPG